jgi:Leucine-rich repeat (LRR) protein
LSHNALTSLPTNLFALPELTTLNVAYNSLTSLPFNAPFASASNNSLIRQATGGSFFTPTITRATSPLPRLLILDASHNKITANAIDLEIPVALTKLDLSANPLGLNEPRCRSLLQALAKSQKLRELRFENAVIGDDAFPPDLFTAAPFPYLRTLDLGQTKVTPEAVKEALKNMKQELIFDVTAEDPPAGVACIIVGKRMIKEAWELELERREKARTTKQSDSEEFDVLPTTSSNWTKRPEVVRKPPTEVIKEAWEIEAEQGLLTEGGKRRARAAAAAATNPQSVLGIGAPSTPTPGHSPKSSTSGLSLASPQYYAQTSQILTLPPSNPPSKSPAHTRAFSLAAPSSSFSLSTSSRTTDIAVPPPTLPLSVIATQPFAHTLKVLVLMNRRLDKSFSLPSLSDTPGGLLPNLEELNLEGCGLPDLVNVVHSDSASGASTPPRTTEPILPLITKLFPSLRTLNLSYNALTSSSFTTNALAALVLETGERKGLKHLRLRGNRLVELDGFQGVAESFKGNREVPAWKLDELDIRDNEVGKLPPELGLLPMDVFLVDGNT